MATRQRLNTAAVVAGAIELVNERGADALSLAELAARFRVRPPSLYNHVDGLDGLRREMALEGLRMLTDRLRTAAAGQAGFDALQSVANAYRQFAKDEPGLYPLTLRSTEDGDVEMQAAGRELMEIVVVALRGYHLQGDAVIHAVRAVRSALHGFVSLEIAGGFMLPVDLDESFGRLLVMLHCGLTTGQ